MISPDTETQGTQADAIQTETKIDFLWDTLKRLDHYIATTNFKSGLVVTANVAILAYLQNQSFSIRTELEGVFDVVMGLLFCSIAGAVAITFRSVFPSFGARSSNTTPPTSILFFGSISRTSASGFCNTVRAITSEQMLEDLCNQTHEVASILQFKFRLLQHAITLTAVTVALLFLIAILA
jgi:hypothetical protein